MADLKKAKDDPRHQLFEVIEDIHAGMLGVEGSGLHMQPMAPMVDRTNACIWFFTGKDHEIFSAVGDGADAKFCVIGEDHDYHACLGGHLTTSEDREIIDRYWSPVVAAWYEQGKDDPNLVLLKMDLRDATIWASTGSGIRFGWEIAKANITDEEPDVGVMQKIDFAHAA